MLLMPHVRRLEADMKDGRIEAMTQELGQIEALINAKVGSKAPSSGPPGGFDIAALQQLMRALPAKIDTFQQHGGDMSRLKPRVESIQRHIAAGELDKAYEERQALDPILDSP